MRKRAWCRVQTKEKGQHGWRGGGCRCCPLLLEEKGQRPESSSVAELSEYVQISFRTKETPRAGMGAGVDLTQEGWAWWGISSRATREGPTRVATWSLWAGGEGPRNE